MTIYKQVHKDKSLTVKTVKQLDKMIEMVDELMGYEQDAKGGGSRILLGDLNVLKTKIHRVRENYVKEGK